MRRLAIANQKGGTAKTTTTVCLAGALAEMGRSVLVVDLDPSVNATTWLDVTPLGSELGAAIAGNGSNASNAGFAGLASDTSIAGVTCIPGSEELVNAERELASQIGAQSFLRAALDGVEGYDYVLVDCPPSLGFLSVLALVAVDEVVIPVECKALPLEGLSQLWETIAVVRDRLNPGLAVTGIVASRYTRTVLANDVVNELNSQYGEQLFRVKVRERTRLGEAPSYAKPITTYDPAGDSALDFRRLAKEIEQRDPALLGARAA